MHGLKLLPAAVPDPGPKDGGEQKSAKSDVQGVQRRLMPKAASKPLGHHSGKGDEGTRNRHRHNGTQEGGQGHAELSIDQRLGRTCFTENTS